VRGVPLEDALDLGRRFILDTGEPWEAEPFQVAALEALCRGVDRVWLEIPEGNAKTTLAAIIGLIHLFLVEDAEIPVAASSRDQAGTLFNQADGIIRRSPGLPSHFRAQKGHRKILCPGAGGFLKIHAADAATADGVIPTLAILEELHRHPSLELYRTWSGKLTKRNGQVLIISTAGDPAGEYEAVKKAAIAQCEIEGEVQREPGLIVATMPGFEMRVHALDAKLDDPEDLEAVHRANPLGALDLEELRKKRAEPTWDLAHWMRFTCGIPTRDFKSAVGETEWEELHRSQIPSGVPIMVGADFGWKHDTTAIVPFWMPPRPSPGAEVHETLAKLYGPDEEPDTSRRIVGRAEVVTPPRNGTSTPPKKVRDAFIRVHLRNPIAVVAMDPSAGGAQIAEWLEAPTGEVEDPDDPEGTLPSYDWELGHGLGVEVVEVSPGNVVQCRVYDAWMEAIREGWLEHPHDAELTRHVLNAIAKRVSHDRYRFDRPSSSRAAKFQDVRVIDALVAASNVHWHATAGLEEPQERPFDLADYRVQVL
jgi:hypothetical protein